MTSIKFIELLTPIYMVFAVKVSKFRILNLQNSRILTLTRESIYRLTFHLAKNHTSSLHHSRYRKQSIEPCPFCRDCALKKEAKKKSQPFGRCSHASPNPSVPKNVSYITLLILCILLSFAFLMHIVRGTPVGGQSLLL